MRRPKGTTGRSSTLSPIRGEFVGRNAFVGKGVQILAVRREVDTALQARFREATSEQSATLVDQRYLTALETLQNELTDNDLSTTLSTFFNSFSEVANNPTDNAVRAVAIQQGQSLANRIADLKGDYDTLRNEIDRDLGNSVEAANDLLDRIADLGLEITRTEGGGTSEANSLRDQRDLLIDELSEYVDLHVVEHDNGNVDILISSIPVLIGGQNRGLELRERSVAGGIEVSVRVAADGTDLNVTSGTRRRTPASA